MHIFLNILQQTLIFLPIVFGVYISYRILGIIDLTVQGSYVLGAAIFARMVTCGFSQLTGIFLALLGGILAGLGVTFMQRVAKIDPLIAGILATFMLYSINFGVMQEPNISLLNGHILLQHLQSYDPNALTAILAAMIIVLGGLLVWITHSRMGLHFRAFGANPALLHKLGKRPALYLAIGLSLSNMLSAFCGVLNAQLDGYADIHMGLGVALTSFGAVVIGVELISVFVQPKQFSAVTGLSGAFIGSFVYFAILNIFLVLGINPIYLKFVIGAILVAFLSTAHYSKQKERAHASPC